MEIVGPLTRDDMSIYIKLGDKGREENVPQKYQFRAIRPIILRELTFHDLISPN